MVNQDHKYSKEESHQVEPGEVEDYSYHLLKSETFPELGDTFPGTFSEEDEGKNGDVKQESYK